MFYSSPRNRPEVQIALLEKLDCDNLLTTEQISEATRGVLDSRAMRTLTLADLNFSSRTNPSSHIPTPRRGKKPVET